ncbi:MAG: phosphate signaling complex protein PhoU, partial [Clostridiales Family XIII bacterium]|jgi:phosphate transport system protein|nr:phosphate signaling complex protein PhoU [Clostridiales Family XIII bacterium]
MSARPVLDSELNAIADAVIEMGVLVENAINDSIKSLKERDSNLAMSIIDGDEIIDDTEDAISDMCLKFFATQQPLAGDLRCVISIMNIIRDLERIGDHCEDIAKYTLRFENEEYIKDLVDIPRMSCMAARMVRNAIDSHVNRDLRLARKVWKADEEIDEMFRDIYDELLVIAENDRTKTKQSVMFLFIAAHLERIADYATNICEETVFVMEGNYEMENAERPRG